MAEDEPGCKVEYVESEDGPAEETNWIKRAGRAKVTYPDGCTFEGCFTPDCKNTPFR